MSVPEPLIAIIEDEAPIRRFLRASLRGEGYRVAEAENARDGLRIITQEHPSVIILDLGLPDMDGTEVIREVRGWSQVPILILSARGQEADKVKALDLGADDYLTKPFGIGELLARIRVALRSSSRIQGVEGPAENSLQFGEVEINLLSRQVTLRGGVVDLTRLEFELLRTLVQNAGKVLTHRFLLKEVWGPHALGESHTLRVFISNLRKKIEVDPTRPRYIQTEQGVGYRLNPD
jgi:two-component system, OmpR family, KDP operon response regulator KdpE